MWQLLPLQHLRHTLDLGDCQWPEWRMSWCQQYSAKVIPLWTFMDTNLAMHDFCWEFGQCGSVFSCCVGSGFNSTWWTATVATGSHGLSFRTSHYLMLLSIGNQETWAALKHFATCGISIRNNIKWNRSMTISKFRVWWLVLGISIRSL